MRKQRRTAGHAHANERARLCPAPSLRDLPIPRHAHLNDSFLFFRPPILGRSLDKGDSTLLAQDTAKSRSSAWHWHHDSSNVPGIKPRVDFRHLPNYIIPSLTLLEPAASYRPRRTVMSSNAPPALSTKTSSTPKSVNTSSQLSPAHSQASAFFAGEGLGQRRSGGSSSSGAVSRSSATPRNIQGAKTKHKSSKRFRLADDDAFAESVSSYTATINA